MAYLPPAGVRLLSNDKRSNLITRREEPDPRFMRRESQNFSDEALRCLSFPYVPIKTSDVDPRWIVPKNPPIESYSCSAASKLLQAKKKAMSGDVFEYGSHSTDDCDWFLYEAAADDFPKIPEESMFLVKPDVRYRYDWLGRWSDEYFRYSGAFGHWTKMYGRKYHYNTEKKSPRAR